MIAITIHKKVSEGNGFGERSLIRRKIKFQTNAPENIPK